LFLIVFENGHISGALGRANPLDPSADQGSVERQDHGRESCVSRHALPVHMLAELVPSRACARTRYRRGSVRLGLGTGAQDSVMRATISRLAPQQRRATAFGI
jgi:hypothetical protein